jgi:hypothetical protein
MGNMEDFIVLIRMFFGLDVAHRLPLLAFHPQICIDLVAMSER